MLFTNFGLVALSALFAATSAAPAPAAQVLPAIADVDVKEVGLPVKLNVRTDDVICQKLSTTIIEVRKHTTVINATISKTRSYGQKSECISSVKTEVISIVQLCSTLVADITVLLTDVTEIVGEVKAEVISLVLELLFEILFTINGVLVQLRLSIFELLGPLILALLAVIINLLAVLNIVVVDLLKIVFGLLGGVHGILSTVLRGLGPIIQGILGGLLGLIGGILSCLL